MDKSQVAKTTVITISMMVLFFNTTYVFAEKPDPGYPNSGDCSWSGPDNKYQTCCWREKVSGKILGEQYCQKCTWVEGQGYVDCTQKELQMLEQPPTTSPTSPDGPATPTQDDRVIEQPDKPNKGGVFDLPNSQDRELDSQ
jgi:hypothetical protein